MGSKPRTLDRDNLDFFNKVSGKLEIQLSEAPERITPNLQNLKAPPAATIESIRLEASVWMPEVEKFRDLTEAELDLPVFESGPLSLRGEGNAVTIDPPAHGVWRIRDLIAAIEVAERRSRADSDWFDGIDVHHVYFEGLTWDGKAWQISWGS